MEVPSRELYKIQNSIRKSSEIRSELGLPVYDPVLAEALGSHASGIYVGQHPSYEQDMAAIVEKMLQRGYSQVAALGPEGSNSHVVALDLQSLLVVKDQEVAPIQLVDNKPSVLRIGLDAHAKTVGLLPVYNTIGGHVSCTPHTSVVRAIKSTRAEVLGVVDARIEHQLLATSSEDYQAPIRDRKVYSHPQALTQCQLALAKLGLRACASDSTSAAAKALAEGELPPHSVVVAPPIAAEIYDLEVVEKDIGNAPKETNWTTMAVVGNPIEV